MPGGEWPSEVLVFVTGDLDLLVIDPNELAIEILTPRLLVERPAAS